MPLRGVGTRAAAGPGRKADRAGKPARQGVRIRPPERIHWLLQSRSPLNPPEHRDGRPLRLPGPCAATLSGSGERSRPHCLARGTRWPPSRPGGARRRYRSALHDRTGCQFVEAPYGQVHELAADRVAALIMKPS